MKSGKKIIAAACALVVAAFVSAEENSADLFADAASSPVETSNDDAKDSFTLKLSGEHEAGFRVPAYADDNEWKYSGAIKAPSLSNDLGLEVRDGAIKFVSRWGFNLSPLSASANGPESNWAEQLEVVPYENYVSWNPSRFKFSFGYQVFSWGVADRKNPTDNLNPRDYTVGPNPDKIPVLAADLIAYPTDSVSVEGVFIPVKGDSIYPMDFADLVVGNSAGQLISSSVSYDDSMADPDRFVAGAKVNYNSPRLDLSFDYLYDIDQFYTPEIALRSGTVPTPLGNLPAYLLDSVSLERKRIHRFGGDAKTTVGRFGLWLEAAYSLTENAGSEDYSARKSKFEYTLGTDANFGPNDSGYVNLQYIGAWTPDYDDGSPSVNSIIMTPFGATESSALEYYQRKSVNLLGLETSGIMQGATCNVKYEFANGLVTPEITAVYMAPFTYDDSEITRLGELALNPEIDIKPVDSFHIKLGADLYYAWYKEKGSDSIKLDTSTDPIGVYTPSNNIYLKVVYKWNDEIRK